MKPKRYRKVVEWQEFASNRNGEDWWVILLLSIPIISSIVVLAYLLSGRKDTYWEEIK